MSLFVDAFSGVRVQALVQAAPLWFDLLAWWRPWSDALLFAALTTAVHFGLYFGARLRFAQMLYV